MRFSELRRPFALSGTEPVASPSAEWPSKSERLMRTIDKRMKQNAWKLTSMCIEPLSGRWFTSLCPAAIPSRVFLVLR
jgi:hypothetical protein